MFSPPVHQVDWSRAAAAAADAAADSAAVFASKHRFCQLASVACHDADDDDGHSGELM